MGIVYLILWYCSGHLKYVQLLLIFNFFYSNKPQFARLPPRLNSFLGGGGGVREGAAKQKRTWLFSAQLLFSTGENFSWNVGGPRAAAGFAFRGALQRLMYYLKGLPSLHSIFEWLFPWPNNSKFQQLFAHDERGLCLPSFHPFCT